METRVEPEQPMSPAEPAARDPQAEFSGLVRRLISRSTAARTTTRVAGAGLTWSALSGTASANPVIPTTFDQRIVRLVNRVCGAFEPVEYCNAFAAGFAPYLAQQLAYDPSADTVLNGYIASDPFGFYQLMTSATTTPFTLWTAVPDALAWARGTQWVTLTRRIMASGRLFERSAEFWSDHFSIDIFDKLNGLIKAIDERDVVRANAFGSFEDMLHASRKSPSMLLYLDNWINAQPNYQENYARELLELHTLGANNGYTEQDVKDVAAIMAGHTLDLTLGPNILQYVYNAAAHDPTPSYSLFTSSPTTVFVSPGHDTQAKELANALASHPNTVQFLALKVARWLLRYDPTTAERNAIEAAYVSSGGSIVDMILAALTPANIDAVNSAQALKLKRPAQLAIGLLRAVSADVAVPAQGGAPPPMAALIAELELLGHAPNAWRNPNGYPDSEAAWAGGTFQRWALMDKLMNNQVPGITVDFLDLVNLLGTFQVPQTGDRLNQVMTGNNLTAAEVAELQTYVNWGVAQIVANTMTVEQVVREAFALTASTPSYQYY